MRLRSSKVVRGNDSVLHQMDPIGKMLDHTVACFCISAWYVLVITCKINHVRAFWSCMYIGNKKKMDKSHGNIECESENGNVDMLDKYR